MIDLYFWPTPNGLKLKLFLEEAGLPYRQILVDIGKGEKHRPEFLKISPNNRIPALVDHDPPDGGAPLSLFESGAMLLYLADNSGKSAGRSLRLRGERLWQAGLGRQSAPISA